MKDRHQHCACNGILLCGSCHAYVHKYPTVAMGSGYIVSRHCEEPGLVPCRTISGWANLTCDGQAQFGPRDWVVIDEGIPMWNSGYVTRKEVE